jgi:hypothetical protein
MYPGSYEHSIFVARRPDEKKARPKTKANKESSDSSE